VRRRGARLGARAGPPRPDAGDGGAGVDDAHRAATEDPGVRLRAAGLGLRRRRARATRGVDARHDRPLSGRRGDVAGRARPAGERHRRGLCGRVAARGRSARTRRVQGAAARLGQRARGADRLLPRRGGPQRGGPGARLAGGLSQTIAAFASTSAPTEIARSSTRRLPWCRSYVGPPGVRVPSRAIAPGSVSTYQAKSSPPRLCAVVATPSGPSAVVTAWRSFSVTAKSLTTGGTPRV